MLEENRKLVSVHDNVKPMGEEVERDQKGEGQPSSTLEQRLTIATIKSLNEQLQVSQ